MKIERESGSEPMHRFLAFWQLNPPHRSVFSPFKLIHSPLPFSLHEILSGTKDLLCSLHLKDQFLLLDEFISYLEAC